MGKLNVATLKKYFRRLIWRKNGPSSKKRQPVITPETMAVMAAARSVSGPHRMGPYLTGPSLRSFAREFLTDYADGDYRTKFGMPDMTVAELQHLRRIAGD